MKLPENLRENLGKSEEQRYLAGILPYNTQDCSRCGTRVRKTLSMRTHICTGCGIVLDRDHNAACNILDKALRTVGHTGTGIPQGV